MKTILRIVIILFVSALICGVTILIVDFPGTAGNNETSYQGIGEQNQPGGELIPGQITEDNPLPRRGGGGGRHGKALETGLPGLETARNFGIITVVIVTVVLIEFFLRRKRRNRGVENKGIARI